MCNGEKLSWHGCNASFSLSHLLLTNQIESEIKKKKFYSWIIMLVGLPHHLLSQFYFFSQFSAQTSTPPWIENYITQGNNPNRCCRNRSTGNHQWCFYLFWNILMEWSVSFQLAQRMMCTSSICYPAMGKTLMSGSLKNRPHPTSKAQQD